MPSLAGPAGAGAASAAKKDAWTLAYAGGLTLRDVSQTQALVETFKSKFSHDLKTIETLDRVALMTPENIHLNSFMYEPIVGMSDSHLKKLYNDVVQLK
jgi:hypothetical protein